MLPIDTSRGFMVFPNRIDEVDGGGDITTLKADAGFCDRLLDSGFPIYDGERDEPFVDLRVEDDGTVIAHQGDAEHVMPAAAAEVFLRWFRTHAEEDR